MPVATDCAWASRASTDAGPSSVIVRGTEPSTPRSAAAHNASVSCCVSGDASDTAASSLVVAAAYAPATAAARAGELGLVEPVADLVLGESQVARGGRPVGRDEGVRPVGQRAERAQSHEPRVPGRRFVQEGHGRRVRGRRSCSEERLAQPLLQLRRLVAAGGLAGEDRREG